MPQQTSSRQRAAGFSLVELMVAVAIGLVLTTVMTVVYLNSKNATRRQDQLSGLQQSVRTAFEYLAFDSRMVGHLGCFTGHGAADLVMTGLIDLSNNFRVGVEGWDYGGTAPGNTYAMTSNLPTDVTTPTSWSNGAGAATAATLAAVSGDASVGITPGSDVLVVRSAAVGRPVRLTAAVAGGSATAIAIDNRSTGTCPDGSANLSGFCAGSFGVLASCTSAQTFQVSSITGASLTLPATSPIQGSMVYAQNSSEVFPMQTVVYYVKRSSNNTGTSLYRRVFDGAQVQDQELVEGVESLQVRYGLDTEPEPNGILNGTYVAATGVTDWTQVIALRVSLLMRSTSRVDANLASASAPVNGTTFTFPTSGDRFDRRVFTTTVALRNRIAYGAP